MKKLAYILQVNWKKIFFILNLVCAMQVFGQSKDIYTIKLKSGLVKKGELIRMVPDSFVIISRHGKPDSIKFEEVISIDFSAKQVVNFLGWKRPVLIKRNVPDEGWSFGYQAGIGVGVDHDLWITTSFIVRLSALKTLKKRLQAGFAIGFDPQEWYNVMMMTALAEGRYYLQKGKPKTVFIYAQGGYGFNLSSPRIVKDGGLNMSGGIGRSFRNKRQNIFSIMLGLRSQNFVKPRNVWTPELGTVGLRMLHYSIRKMEIKFEWRF